MSRGETGSAQAGFSLIEMLVALALLAMMSGVVAAAVASVGQVARRDSVSNPATDTISAAQIILRQRLTEMRAVRRIDRAEPTVDMLGTGTSLGFIASPADNRPALTGQRRYRLLLTAPGDLVLFDLPDLVTDVDPLMPSITGWTPTVLMRGVARIDIAYFGADPAGGPPSWQQSWMDRSALPTVIRLRVEFPAGDPRRWQELYVRPAATQDLACIRPTADRDCG